MPFSDRIQLSLAEVRKTLARVWLALLVSMAVGACVHGYVPDAILANIMGKTQWWSVPLAVLVGIPLYMNAATILPVVQACLVKGAALGTVLAFMMSVIGLSLPELLLLRRVLGARLIAIFVAVVGTGIVIVGFLFNIVA